MLKRYIVILILLAIAHDCTAQSWQWARRGGAGGSSGANYDDVYDMKVDRNGNTYSLITFDGDYPRTIATSNDIPTDDSDLAIIGVQDVGIVSYNKCGRLRWYKIIGTLSQDYAVNIGLDTQANVYATFNARFSNLKIGNDTLLPNSKRKNLNLVKFDSSGIYKWIRQANPDTVSSLKNGREYSVFASYTTKIGDTYMLCVMGTGLISGSSNLVATTPGWYMLKYNSVGVPKELIKMDITLNENVSFSSQNFKLECSNTGNFFLSAYFDFSVATGPSYFGTQQIKSPITISCFSPTGQFIWNVENKNLSGAGSIANMFVDDINNKIYIGGALRVNDMINNFVATNCVGCTGYLLPFVGCLDTLGNNIWMKNGYVTYAGAYSYVGTLTPNGKLYVAGNIVGSIDWGNGYNWNPNSVSQGYLTAFDVNTTNVIGFDSVRGTSGTTNIKVYAADNANNVYASVRYSNNLTIGTQNFGLIGGSYDFAIAKYGFSDCGVVPLKFMSFKTQYQPTPNPSKEGNVLLQLQTANEINVSHFNIQRSLNGRDFINIGNVKAQNKSINKYTFFDSPPVGGLGVVYYRIESIDKDGKKQYSETKRVTLNDKQETRNVVLFPNPAKEFVTVECKAAKELLIIDCLGRIVYKQILRQAQNDNHQSTTINVQQLNRGLYLLKVITANGATEISKFMKE